MSKYINTEELHKVVLKRKTEYGSLADLIDNIVEEMVKETPYADVVEREKILDFIEDNRPTDVQTDWERGCAYICDEIEKLLK